MEETAIVLHDALGRWPEDLGFTTPPGWIRPDHHEEEGPAGRQAFVSVTAPALVAGPVQPQHVDPALIDYFQQQLEGHYRADMFLGPHDLIGTVSAQYQLIDKLVRCAKGETRQGLLRVGAAYAALVGWLYQDAYDMDGAAFWRGITQEIAMRSRDPHLIGYSLVNQAQVRTDLGDGHAVVDLCEAALDDVDRLVPKVRIMAMQQHAHGASLIGERGLVDLLIDQADRLLRRVDDDLPWGNACRMDTRISRSAARYLLRPSRARCGGRRSVDTGALRRTGDGPSRPRGVHGQAGDGGRSSAGAGSGGGARAHGGADRVGDPLGQDAPGVGHSGACDAAVAGCPGRPGSRRDSGACDRGELSVSKGPVPLTDSAIEGRLLELRGWSRVGDEITRSFGIRYHGGVAMIVHVADVERLIGHHADIDLRWDRIRFGITTHDAGYKLTDADFDLAARIDQIAAAHGAEPEA